MPPSETENLAPASPNSAPKMEERPLYPYSVIPGGVRSPQELKAAVLRDAVVAAHYADFDVTHSRVIRLDMDRAMYVSYRLGDHVYWTMKMLRIPKGETIITDGVHVARTRCGNRLSETPVQPVSPLQPPERVMSLPEAPILVAVNQPPVEFPVGGLVPPVTSGITPPGGGTTPPGGGIIPPIYYPPITGGPPKKNKGTKPPPPPPILMPEPGTIILLAIGLGGLLAIGRVSWIRNKRKS